jgi:hypothetical protein
MNENIVRDYRENGMEWLNGQDTVTFSFAQKKFINRIKALAEKYPDEVIIYAENKDGSITGNLPLKFVRISAPRQITIDDERRAFLAERLQSYRKTKVKEE